MATLKDIAERAGVTVTTVSRVINNRGYISDRTRRRVNEVMQELNYQPNEVARALTKRHTNMIGLIVPHISHPFFARLISCMESEAAKRGYRILLCNSKEEPEREEAYLNMCLSNRVAGIVLCSRNIEVEKLRELEVPIVNFEKENEEATVSIQCDNYGGGRLAAEHLYRKGCRELLHFGGVKGRSMPADQRAEGFARTCRENGCGYRIVLSDRKVYDTMDYKEMIRGALLAYPEADGIFASSDLIAAQAIQVCRELDIDVPGTMRIVGFDDVMLAGLTTPAITSIHQPVRKMAELAVDCIASGKRGQAEVMKLPVYLVEREST